MKQFKSEPQRVPDFVLLKVADEVPASPAGDEGDFGPRFLDAAFSKERLAFLERRPAVFTGT